MSESLTLGPHWVPPPWANGITQVQTSPSKSRNLQHEADSALVGTERREKQFHDCIAKINSYQRLPVNWDKYGGVAASAEPLEFANKLLQELAGATNLSAPVVRPVSGGVYLEWRVGDTFLYFEADNESVLGYSKTAIGEGTSEDPDFDWETAFESVKSFYDNAT